MRGFQDRAEVADVVTLLRERLTALGPEMVNLRQATSRVLALEVVAEFDVPSFNRAAMDGYALGGEATFGASAYGPLEFEVIGVALPGSAFPGRVELGQAVRIMTGAPLPEGAGTILPAEEAEELTDGLKARIRTTGAVPPGRHVGLRGEDIGAGTLVFRPGRVLRPQDCGVLASLGRSAVSVVRRPTVAVIVTGDELLPCGSKADGFRIVDSNSVMLEALIHRDGGMPRVFPIVPDRAEAFREALTEADQDVILVSGGSSVGQEDHAPRILAEIGSLPIHGMALRPASPTGIGFLGGRPVFLLPGNPVSCLCGYDLFAGPAIRRLGGRSMELPYRSGIKRLGRKLASAAGRVDYVRVTIEDDAVIPLATSGASILSSTTKATGFVLVPRDSAGFPPGTMVTVYLYD